MYNHSGIVYVRVCELCAHVVYVLISTYIYYYNYILAAAAAECGVCGRACVRAYIHVRFSLVEKVFFSFSVFFSGETGTFFIILLLLLFSS